MMETENNYENKPQDTEEKRHFESCSDALRSGREEATAKAREAAPKLKAAVADVIFDVAYGAAYGACFAGAFANEFVPKTVKDVVGKGVAKGAAAGRSAADKVRGHTEMKTSDNDVTETDPAGLPAPA
jgi:hypothetical protein